MRQTTLDSFCQVKTSHRWMNAFEKNKVNQTLRRSPQVNKEGKTMPQSQREKKNMASSMGSKKRKLADEENACKKRSPFTQNEGGSHVNVKECLLTSDEEVSIIEAVIAEERLVQEETPKLSQCSNEKTEWNVQKENKNKSPSALRTDSPPKNSKTRTPNTTPNKRTSFSPKTPTSLSRTPSPKKTTHRRLFSNLIETSLLFQALEQMNLAKEGAIRANNFDLEEIYGTNNFMFEYSKINPSTTTRYDEENVVMPLESHSEHMFTVITTVFSNPVNCGYFPESELDFVFSILTLSKRAQMLFIRMLKRKLTWHRVGLLNYPEITDDLEPLFKELISKSFCDSDIATEDMLTMLGLLQVDELTKICREIKISGAGSKDTKIENILKSYKTSKPLFPGMKAPIDTLISLIKSKLGTCVRVSAKAVRIFNKIITLLIPNRDPEQTISDMFFMLRNVQTGEVMFPKVPVHHFPIFANTAQLEGYAEAKAVYTKILNCIKHKEWEEVRVHGRECYACASNALETESKRLENSILPIHVKRFTPLYIWLKALSKTVDVFKKTPETMHEAVQILNFLLSQNCFLLHYRAKWYAELALIEMHHHKDLETSAAITLAALTEDNLTDVDLTDLLARAQMLVKRKTGIRDDTKKKVQEILKQMISRVPELNAMTTTIQATSFIRHEQGSKAVWLIEMPEDTSRLGTVEQLALQRYCDEGFSRGVHCESILPLTLFYTLLWDEIYDLDVPGAWVTNYQSLPCDLTTETFYETRKKRIDEKFEFVSGLDSETLSDIMEAKFNEAVKYSHITESNPFKNGSHFKEVINCLGVRSVTGICRKLATNYSTWKAGFPDLIVWNPTTGKCKIVEVKGPTDKLSTKQKLWLQYLIELNVDAEVCLVQGDARYKPKFSNKPREDIPDT